jgi:hypothetical protein
VRLLALLNFKKSTQRKATRSERRVVQQQTRGILAYNMNFYDEDSEGEDDADYFCDTEYTNHDGTVAKLRDFDHDCQRRLVDGTFTELDCLVGDTPFDRAINFGRGNAPRTT